MKLQQIILSGGVSYPLPEIVGNGPGVLGEKTLSFVSDGKMVHVWRDNVQVIQVNNGQHKSRVADHYERIVLNSSATYHPANVIHQDKWVDYGVDDVFGDEQLVFTTLEGLFIVRKNNVVSLVGVVQSSGITSQPVN